MNLDKLLEINMINQYFTFSKGVLIIIFILFTNTLFAQDKVFVIEIRDEIDPRMERYVDLAFTEAEDLNVDYVIIDMNTYGGRVDNADFIRQRILDFKKPVWVWINQNAASAGALISIACDSIYMTKGSTIGAATVVTGDGNKAAGKYQSYFVAKMRATAEAKGRNPDVAAAMVDDKVKVDSSQQGKVLTLPTEKAIEYGYCEGVRTSIEDVLDQNKIQNPDMIHYELSWSEQVIRLFLNPFLSGILLLIVLGGIYFELQSPGMGFPGIAAAVAAVFYFIPYYFNGLAEYWEAAIFIVGVLLLVAEVLFIPGTGIAGILGVILSVGGLVLMMVGNIWFDFSYVSWADISDSLITVFIALVGGTTLVIWAIPRIFRSKRFNQIALQDTMSREDGYTSTNYLEDLVGAMGTAYTVLRPSGKVKIEEKLYDAFTQGDFIDKNKDIIVISQEGMSLKVKKADKV